MASVALITWAVPTFAGEVVVPEAPAPKLPTRLAMLPFRCANGCDDLNKLQQGLLDRLVEDSTFEVVLDEQTEGLFLEPAQYRRAYDGLSGRASAGLAPDSTNAATLMRRFHVDGFLYGYMGPEGPVVEIWSGKPSAGIVFHYATQAVSTNQALPEAERGNAGSRGAIPMTGGASTSGNTGGSPSKSSGKSTAPSSELKTGSERGGSVQMAGSLDDKTREMISNISDKLKKRRKVELKVTNG